MILSAILAAFGGAAAQKAINTAADSIRTHAGQNVLDGMSKAAQVARAGAATRNQSLVSYSAPGRLEPICYVDSACADSPMLPALLQAELSIFMGYWLRAFQLDNTRIDGVSVASKLEKFSTHRAPDYLGSIGLEDIGNFLPFDNKIKDTPAVFKEQAALEAASIRGNARAIARGNKSGGLTNDAKALMGIEVRTGTAGGGRIQASDIFDTDANLAVGRIYNVEIVSDNVRQTVPVVARMNIMTVPTEAMVHIYTSSSQDISASSRIRQWWRGRIDFWRDLIFAQDLIDAHKKNLRADTSGFYQTMLKRRSDNVNAALVSGVPSVAASATIVIMSAQTADDIAMKLGDGGIHNFANRQKFFVQGYAMLLAVVDDRRGRVRMYTRDIAEWTDLDARGLENASRGNGPNVTDILAAFRAGGSPML